MSEELNKLNTLLAIKVKQDIGEGLSREELDFVNKTIKEGIKR